ncbi:DUF952 domain-containing protein [Nocardioides donggukensis]|uniref:DUF952 domain-containing protein n=1 Tax=Nocardioides donggukensis TaxID=2774019 RepID=A0A927K6U4_9ACTN|nr:DUF952 domain-containing protein [Nocardioides donggukensis]MBD8870083.1 DUF952 domain-containing protein [Nocardioides donggukensis]
MRIFHVAERSRWEAAKLAGSYAWSTLGRTLEEEGFIHAARADQWPRVLERFYADPPGPLVLLTIETDLLTSPWREDRVGEDTFPHIHGPLNPAAVVAEEPLAWAGTTAEGRGSDPRPSFAQVFVGEMAVRMLAAAAVMVLAIGCGVAVSVLVNERLGLVGLLAGVALGVALVLPVARRRRERRQG